MTRPARVRLAGPTGAGPNARVTHAATWYDPIGRTLAAADYGTNGGGVLARPAAPPAPSDDVPVSTVEYDGAGRTAATVAPDGLRSEFAYDARGRRTAVVENVAPGSSDADANRTTRFAYTPDGELAALTAENAAGPQTTAYEYGTTLADSAVASSALLRRVRLPDAAGPADAVTYAYDRQGALAATTDQNGTTHAFEYDGLGRRVADRVDALGTGVDGAVRRVETARDARGLPVRLTTRDAPTGGAVVNEVTREHDAWGRLTREFQSHAGPVTASTPSVRYGYADGSNGALRATSLTYPDGRVLEYGYGPAGSPADATDRVAALTWDGTVVQEVDRLGSGAAAGLRLPEPGVHRLWKLGGTDPETGDAYGGADRFGREARTRWRNASGTDLVAQDLGHDRAGGRTHRRDLAAGAAGAGRDELYGRDGLRRLETFGRGALNAAGDALAAETFAQAWSLDATGNWAAFIEGPSAASPALEQTRTANAANEIVGIAETAGPAWATPAHDAAGNMIVVPRPADPTGTLAAVYDAWNRPVRLTDGGTVVQKNAYDARGFRVVRTEAVGEAKSKRAKPSPKTETRRVYHSAGWQVLEERVGGSSAADRQYVWGTRYVDELVLRDRDAGAGSPGGRLYALQDANWNVAAVADASGAVAERYGYAAYGEPQALAPDWTPRPATAFAWETLYAGYRRDPTGLYHVRHRVLHPQLGGWLSRDPAGYVGGASLLEYANSAPVDAADPLGLYVPPASSRLSMRSTTQCHGPLGRRGSRNSSGSGATSFDPELLSKAGGYERRFFDRLEAGGLDDYSLCQILGEYLRARGNAAAGFNDFTDNATEEGKAAGHRIEAYLRTQGRLAKPTIDQSGGLGFSTKYKWNGVENLRHFLGVMEHGRLGAIADNYTGRPSGGGFSPPQWMKYADAYRNMDYRRMREVQSQAATNMASADIRDSFPYRDQETEWGPGTTGKEAEKIANDWMKEFCGPGNQKMPPEDKGMCRGASAPPLSKDEINALTRFIRDNQ